MREHCPGCDGSPPALNRRLVVENLGDGWWAPLDGTSWSLDGLRIERSSPGRPGRVVIEASDVLLEELARRLEMPLVEAPPVHELKDRIARLAQRIARLEALKG